MRTIRLSDLVQQSRQAKQSEPERPAAPAEPVAVKAAVEEPRKPAASPEPEMSTDVADKIEVLAFQLLSISKTTKTNPRAVLVEALTSIDRCISSLAPRA